MRKNDIQINGNIIGGRQGFAYICNSMIYEVLKADLDKEQEYKGYSQFGKVRVIKKYKDTEIAIEGTLEAEDGKWTIGGSGCCLKAGFGFSDMMNSIEEASLPRLHEGDIVAIAMYSKKIEFASLSLFKVGKIDSNCMVMAHLIPLDEAEMNIVRQDTERWCNR